MAFQGNCPSCGAPVEFGVANSVVVVCDSCSSVVGRGDGKLEEYGKVADLVQTDSPLQVGLSGEYKGVPYEITGRTQIRHAAGGVWDEWYIALRDGRKWGWLAEAQGRYYLTFPKQLSSEHPIPPVRELRLEDEVMVPGLGRMKVVESGVAETVGAEGELPFAVQPGQRVHYADLQGPGGKFATIDDSSDPPALYVGGEFSLEKLGIAHAESREEAERTASAVGVNCPNCGGSLELRAPDESQRVACPYCDSMLDATQGSLKFLHVLTQNRIQPTIPLGSQGSLRGREYTVIGFMQRMVVAEGQAYPWNEYLLYTPRQPFHWLLENQRHWTLAKPVSAGDVRAHLRTAEWRGRHFKIFDRSSPQVMTVYGEFYWKVEVGERVRAADYVSPPYILSREASIVEPKPVAEPPAQQPGMQQPGMQQLGMQQPGMPAAWAQQAAAPPPEEKGLAAQEVNYTVGEYLPVKEVQQAFGIANLPKPQNIAPNQPYPFKDFYPLALIMLGIALLAGALVFISIRPRTVLYQEFVYPTAQAANQELVSTPFRMTSLRNVRIRFQTLRAGRWAYADGTLYNETTRRAIPFTAAIEQSQAGPRRSRDKYLSSVPAGQYTLKLRMKFQPGMSGPQTVKVRIDQGAVRFWPWLLLFGAIGLPLVGVIIHHFSFEARRWAESSEAGFSLELE